MEGTQENPTPIVAADCTLPETAASLGTVGGQTDGAGPGHTVRIVSPHMCHADNWSRMGRAITGCFDFFQTLFLKAVSQFSSVTQSCLTLHDPIGCSTPGLPVHHLLPKLAQTHVPRVGDAIQPSHPLSSPSPPTHNPPSIRVFSNESVLLINWPKYRSFSFSISPSNEYSGLISLRIGWFNLLEVQEGLSRVSSNTIVQKHQFFSPQFSLWSYSHIHT